ncbi:YisL family protein [Bacillus sp. FJAT-22090]|uniref:YisL family protein n=1 Tax=Bacillus sp. FJAT-22090 TaxID=1581038 RepID=UPI0011AA9FA3|nr:YisL family protein [Bacillus sp. FJAT-22090]
MDFLASTHLHITTWVIALILFFVALAIKNPKVVHMILRVFYILIILTGIALFMKGMDYGQGMLYGLKFLAGILVIGMMEMTLVKKTKGKPFTTFLVLFFVFLLIALFLGFKLPMGINFLA